MNWVSAFVSSPFAIAAGWAVLHCLWQGAALTLGAALSLRWLRGHAPEARYSAGLGALALMALMPLLTFAVVYRPDASAMVQETAPIAHGGATSTHQALNDAPHLTDSAQAGESRAPYPSLWLGWLAFLWLTGVSAMSLRLLGGFVVAQRLRHAMVQQAAEQWRALAEKWKLGLGITRAITVYESPLVDVPLIIGWLRPVLLLPAEGLRLLRLEQIEALLIHELAHVRRNDYLVNLLQSLLETFLFFHPGVWWLSARVRLERECCCDAITLRLHADRDAYAEALVSLETMRAAAVPQSAMAALRPGQLLRRIQRMYESPAVETGRRPWGAVLVATCILMAGALTAVSSQPEPHTAERQLATAQSAPEQQAAPVTPEATAAAAPTPTPVASPTPIAPAALLLPIQIVGASALAEPARQLDELLAVRLSAADGLRLVDRQQMDAAMQELRLAQSGLTSPDAALQLGKLTGATTIIAPKMMRLDRKNTLTARVIDTATTEYRQVEVALGEDQPLTALADEAAAKLAPMLAAGDATGTVTTTDDREITALRAAFEGKRLPRVTVSIPESHLGTFVPDPAGEIEMMKTLRALGFTVVDVNTLATRRDSTSWLDLFFDRSPEDGDFAVALREGLQNAATLEHNAKIERLKTRTDIFLIGEAFSESVGEVQGFQSCQARVEVKAIDVANGKVAAADSAHANAADLGEFIAGKKALREAGRQAALSIAPVLANYWTARPPEPEQ